MPLRKTAFAHGEYYHIYNRGNSKQTIFHDTKDRERFIGLLYALNQVSSFKIDSLNKYQTLLDVIRDKKLVALGSYVLMSNHFHMLITEIEDGGITTFMRKVMTGYVMYYNKKYKRTGSLFEGRFKAEHVDEDRYLKYLFSYIHLNPIKLIDKGWKEKGIKNKKKAIDFLHTYKYSSFLDFQGEIRKWHKILDLKYFPNYFPTPKDFIREIMSWVDFR